MSSSSTALAVTVLIVQIVTLVALIYIVYIVTLERKKLTRLFSGIMKTLLGSGESSGQ